MKKKNKILKTVLYCFRLMYRSTKFTFICHIAVSSLLSLYALLNVNMLKWIIDILTDKTSQSNKIYYAVIAYILALVLYELLQSLKKILWDHSCEKARNSFLRAVYEKLIAMPMEYVDSERGRDAVDDVVWMAELLPDMAYDIWECIYVLVKFCIVFFALIVFHPKFTLIALGLIIPSVIGELISSRQSDSLRRKKAPSARKIRYYRWLLTDRVPAKDIRMYDLSEPLTRRYEEERKTYQKAYRELDRKHVIISTATEIIKYGGEVLFSLAAIMMALGGKLTIGDMTLYIGYIVIASNSFERLTGSVCNICFNLPRQLARVFEYEEMPGEEVTGELRLSPEEFESLEFEKVYFKYPTSDQFVLKGVSFVIRRGEKVSMVGINGSGKSTIIKVMLGLYKIESGVIRINGIPMEKYRIQDVRRLFSVLFQSYAQYALTLRETIGLSSPDRMDDDGKMFDVMQRSGVSEFYNKFSDGLETYVTKQFSDDGVELSRGQHQKLALCRAYFKDAPIIILDEPSAALDAEAEDRIFGDFEHISQGKTGIMISHRISGSRMADKIIVIQDGVVCECGTHEELVSCESGVYAGLYQMQKKKYTVERT